MHNKKAKITIKGTAKTIAVSFFFSAIIIVLSFIILGNYSQKGIIQGTIDNAQEDNKTPLEIKLNYIADLIGYFGLGSAIITFIALIIQLIIEYFKTAEMSFSEGLYL